MTPGEHCERHEREIERLRDEKAEQARSISAKEVQIVALQRDLVSLEERLPPNLGEWMGKVSTTLETLARGQDSVVEALNKGYVTVAEFEPVKAAVGKCITKEEFGPIKGTFYKAWAVIGTAILAALLTLVMRGKV